MSKIKLQSSDGQIYKVDKEAIAKASTVIEAMIAKNDTNLTPKTGTDTRILHLPNINSNVLIKIIEWVKYHKDTDSVINPKSVDELSEWDRTFLQLEENMLYKLIVAANFMSIKGLLDAGFLVVAKLLQDKTDKKNAAKKASGEAKTDSASSSNSSGNDSTTASDYSFCDLEDSPSE